MDRSTCRFRVTFDEFCRTVAPDQKADLIAGVIYPASPETTDANALFGWLCGLIGNFAEETDQGKVFAQRVALRLGPYDGPEPDILFVKAENESRIQRGHIDGPADLAVEIVSPDSVERDYEKKRKQYEEYGITEYWIIDEELRDITLLRLSAGGKYRLVKPRKGVLRSEVLDGFWLRPEWLWQDPRPKKLSVLRLILGE